MKRTERLFARVVSATLSVALALSFNVAPLAAAEPPSTTPPPATPSPTPSIVREIPERRTSSSKTYLLSDGTYRGEYFTEPVHVKDSTGAWKTIDLSIVPSASDPSCLTVKRSPVAASFKGGGQGARLSKGAYFAEIDLLDCVEPAPMELGGEVIYPQVLPFTDLTYAPRPDGLKETLVLSSPLAPATFRFFVSLGALTAVPSPGGGAHLVSQDGVTRGEIDPLMVLDSSADAMGDPAVCATASMTIEPATGGAYVTYTLDRAWLSDAARVYPVKVDPSMWFCADGAADGGVLDSFIFDQQSSANPTYYYTHESLFVGMNAANGATYRSLLDFDISNLLAIPGRVRVTSSTMSVYNFAVATTYSHSTYLKRCTSSWNYHVYWQTRPSIADYASQTVWGSAGKWVTWNTKALMNLWLTGTPEYGVMLMQNTGDSSNWHYSYRSSNYSTGSSYRPRLLVDYDVPSSSVTVAEGGSVRVGDTITVSTQANTRNASSVDQLRLMPHAGAEKFGEIGWFKTSASVPATWTVHQSNSGGVWASADASEAATYKLEPIWGLCATQLVAGDPGYRRATFKLQVSDALAGVNDLDFDVRFTIGADPAFDSGVVTKHTDINVSPPVPTLRVETTASAGWFAESDADADGANDARNDTNASGRGAVTLSWDNDGLSTEGYKLYLSDGGTYRLIATLGASQTSWSSSGKGLFPADSWIEANSAALASGTVDPFASAGLEFRDDPGPLYRHTPGSELDDTGAYFFKLVPIDGGVADPASVAEPVAVTLDSRTIHLNDDVRHTTEEIGSFVQHSISGVLDKGRLQVQVDDLSLASYGPAAELSRVYRSDDTSSHGFSPGWRFSFDQSVETSGTASRTWVDATGESHPFSLDATSGAWVAPRGLAASMSVGVSGTTIELADHAVLAFSAIDGKLASVTDRRGDRVTYAAIGDDLVVTAANGRSITIDRDGLGNVLSASDGTREVTYANTATACVTYFPNKDEQRVVEYGYASSRLSGIALRDWPGPGEQSAYTFTYDGSGHLAEAREPGYASDTDKKAQISYGAASAAISRSGEAFGTRTLVTNSYTWNPTGTMATKTDAKTAAEATATWRYDYSPFNELALEVSPTGAKKARVVNAAGELLYEYDEMGHVTAYRYNDQGDCVSETDPRGCQTYRSFDATGNLTCEEKVLTTLGERAVTAWQYDEHGLATSESRRASADETLTTLHAYDLSGQAASDTVLGVRLSTSVTQDLTTRRTFDAFGNVIAEYDATDALVASSTLDLAGRVIASRDATGTLTHHVYDALGNEVETWRSSSSTSTKADWSKKTFDAMGRVSSETVLLHDASRTVTQTVITHEYDPMGREVHTDDAVVGGLAARSDFDARGNAVQTWPEGVSGYSDERSTRTDYDAYGRRWRTYEPGTSNVASTFTYYADGEVLRETRADGSWTGYVYDRGGNRIEETATVAGGTSIATFVYDIGGRLVSETDADGVITAHYYDLLGREVSSKGEGPSSETTYNALGNVISKTDADGIRTETTYDTSGRVTREDVIAPGGITKTTTGTYDELGRKLTSTDPDGKVLSLGYDVFGRATSELHTTEKGLIKSETRAYDSLGRLSSSTDGLSGVYRAYTYPAGTVGPTTLRTEYAGCVTTATIASDGRETSRVSSLAGVEVSRTSGLYDSAGRETTWSVGVSQYSRTFDDAGRLTGWSSSGVSGSIGYDAAAKKASETYSGGLGSATSSRFTYTDAGRLSETYRSGVGTETLSFDAAGNLTTSTADGVTTVMTYDSATQRLVNRSAGSQITAYTFDALGRRVTQGPVEDPDARTFTYTGTGRLESYASTTGVSATYSYDAVGLRTRRSISDGSLSTTSTFVYEGLNLLSLSAARTDGATFTLTYLYDSSARAYAGIYEASDASATAFQMVTTDRGDVVELLDASGASFAAYGYDEWGVSTLATSSATALVSANLAQAISKRQPLRYAGYCFDAEEGLYYLSARTYDPLTRQFLSKDPAKADGEESAYQYCGGDPVGKVDPSGLWNRDVHYTRTLGWARTLGYPSVLAQAVAWADVGVDSRYHWSALTFRNRKWHMSSAWGYTMRRTAIESGSLTKLGWALHTLQDYQTHRHATLNKLGAIAGNHQDLWLRAPASYRVATVQISEETLRMFRNRWGGNFVSWARSYNRYGG
jgi:RHS repeat-associated protein